jgi:hypothetical protein
MHRLRLVGEDGTKVLLYFEPGSVEFPQPDLEVEVRGKLQQTQFRPQLGPPRPFTFGFVQSIRPVAR